MLFRSLVPCPPGTNVVTGKWLFRHKLTSDGSLDRYKARWVLRGFTQRPGVDYDETFSPVVKFATVRVVFSLALSCDWAIHQLDVKYAFLHGTLTETVYCSQPIGFVDADRPDLVCRQNRSLYGLKQAPRAWYSRFASYLSSLGFVDVTRPIPGPAVLTPSSSLGSYIVPTDQHESFVCTLSSLMRSRENFSVGHSS